MKSKLTDIEQNQRAQIHATSQIINTEHDKINKAMNKCIKLQEDIDIDRKERKLAIVAMVNDIPNTQLFENAAKMNMEFIFEDNIDNMISFDIYADEERESMESALGVAGSDCENCKDELHRLRQQLKQFESAHEKLYYELGECIVEWASCEQLGRAKDKLDEKRVEEIEKQKNKYSLCKEQLKRTDLSKSQYEEIFGLCKELLKRTDLSKSQYEEIFG
eukprot:907641_1